MRSLYLKRIKAEEFSSFSEGNNKKNIIKKFLTSLRLDGYLPDRKSVSMSEKKNKGWGVKGLAIRVGKEKAKWQRSISIYNYIGNYIIDRLNKKIISLDKIILKSVMK